MAICCQIMTFLEVCAASTARVAGIQPQRGDPTSAQGNALGKRGLRSESPEGATQVMPQSLARLHVHLIFGTKNREQVLHDQVRVGAFSSFASFTVATIFLASSAEGWPGAAGRSR